MPCRAILLLTFLAVPLAAQAASPPTLTFSREHTELQAVALQLMTAQGSGAALDPDYMDVAAVDLNDDGTPELLAFYNGDWFCGTAGCVPDLMVKTNGSYKVVDLGLNDFINGYPPMWSVLSTKHNGFYDLKLSESEFETTFTWDGKGYVSAD